MKEVTKELDKISKTPLQIYTLGQFMVCHGTEMVSQKTARSYRLWELFKYLLTNRYKETFSEIIVENLWPEQDYADPRHALRTLVYRLRQIIDEKSSSEQPSYIKFSHGAYSWNNDNDYWLDAEEFEKLCLKSQELSVSETEKSIVMYLEALALYKGDYLSELAYSEWVIPIRNYYHRLYIRAVLEATALLEKSQRFQEIIQICEKAFQIEFFDEEIHQRFLQALLKEGKPRQALAHYDYASAIFYRDLGVKPSSAMRDLYREIQQNANISEQDLTSVQESLSGPQNNNGAFSCDPEVFRFLYELEVRRAERSGKSVVLAVLILSTADFSIPDKQSLKAAMDSVESTLLSSLRRGDAVSRWNDNQFLLIPPDLSFEQAEKVMERIIKKANRLLNRERFVLRFKVKSVQSSSLQL